jgi:hypothetical protein
MTRKTSAKTNKKKQKKEGLTITEVAMRMGLKYQRTRDLMIEGSCGPTKVRDDGRLVCLDVAAVDACKTRLNDAINSPLVGKKS